MYKTNNYTILDCATCNKPQIVFYRNRRWLSSELKDFARETLWKDILKREAMIVLLMRKLNRNSYQPCECAKNKDTNEVVVNAAKWFIAKDELEMAKLSTKLESNGLRKIPCNRCGGLCIFPVPHWPLGGLCFRCEGKGTDPHIFEDGEGNLYRVNDHGHRHLVRKALDTVQAPQVAENTEPQKKGRFQLVRKDKTVEHFDTREELDARFKELAGGVMPAPVQDGLVPHTCKAHKLEEREYTKGNRTAVVCTCGRWVKWASKTDKTSATLLR